MTTNSIHETWLTMRIFCSENPLENNHIWCLIIIVSHVHLCHFPLVVYRKVLAYRSPPLSNSRIPLLGGGVWWGRGRGIFSGTAVLLLVFVNKTLHGNGK